jgi:hypothetical protein
MPTSNARLRRALLLPAALLALTPLLASAPRARAGETASYVVLEGLRVGEGYRRAAKRLADHHGGAPIVPFDPEHPEGVLERLRALAPAQVAIVLEPADIQVNTVRRILRMATQVDDDPFVDFDFGYVTGATGEEAEAFVEHIVKASEGRIPRRVGHAAVWGGNGPSTSKEGTYTVGDRSFPSREMVFRAPAAEQDRDEAFLAEHLSDLEGCGAILMGGHGMPWEIGSGPRAEDLSGLDLFPSVVLNYACYTAVTRAYPEPSYGPGVVTEHMKEVEPRRSFALALLRSGAVGYVAYVNPRPAGPEMTTDFERILTGSTLGEARRRDYDKVVLGYLGWGEKGIAVSDVVEGRTTPRSAIDPVRHMMLDGATGGILYGDPAFRPFPPDASARPLSSEIAKDGASLRITLRLRGREAYLWGADPFRRFDDDAGTMAMKLYGRVALPEDAGAVRSVRVVECTWGGKRVETLPAVWAEERDGGRRWLQVKVGFARGGNGDIAAVLVAGPDEPSPEIEEPAPARHEAPGATEAPPEAEAKTPAAAAVARANALLLQGGILGAEDLHGLAALGAEAFDAVLDLLRRGEGHYRTHELVAATKTDGGARRLIALAEGPDLPRFNSWIAIESLGHFDEPAVRAWLMDRMATERDAGRFLAAAQALAFLQEPSAVKPVAKRLLAFDPGWAGVQPHLARVLGDLGGEAAATALASFARDDRAVGDAAVLNALMALARIDVERAREVAETVRKSERYAAFSDPAKAVFERVFAH